MTTQHEGQDHHDETRLLVDRRPGAGARARGLRQHGRAPRRPEAAVADEGRGEGGATPTERQTISKAGAEQIIPKEKKRAISADARADFEKAMKRYQAAKKVGGLSRRECCSVSDAFKRVADDNPGLVEARFNQGAVLLRVRPRGRRGPRGSGRGCKYGPAITNLGYIAWKNNEHGPRRVAVQRAPSRTIRCTPSRPATTWRRSCATRRAAPSGDEKKHYVGQAVSNLRTVLALDSNNLQAFSTLAFIYYDMNMLEMAKLVGNQAIKKADEIATGKFEEEKVEEAAEGKAGKARARRTRRRRRRARRRRRREAAKEVASARPARASPPT